MENTLLTIAIGSNEVAFAVASQKAKINPKLEDIDWREMGQKMWQDLIDGYTSSQKEVIRWRNTYWFLATVVQAGYAHTDIQSALSQVSVNSNLLSEPYQGVLRSIQETGGLSQVALELEDLHLAAGIIYHLIIPGSQSVLGTPPEAIGSAATSRL